MLFCDDISALIGWSWRMDPIKEFDEESIEFPNFVPEDQVKEWWEWWAEHHYVISLQVETRESDMYRWQITDDVALALKMRWIGLSRR